MMGSPGYTDPHYLRTGIASKKNDIYSFGVLVLKLITGMEAFCSKRGHILTSMVDGDHCEFIPDTVDRRLNGDFDLKEAKAMASLASACIQQSPTLRPSAPQILETMRRHHQLLH
ncbi:hypothetical protein SAY86_012227 [Trapa natans]|uniref:non-specific serine/threonine protein kinase n=1 Tax=Trapa natans TaxID=22666 RepID=A0AAN7LRT4_TRANT|nr:hypothetical protein SAY86_012227 [Trapa natans]